MSTDVFLNSDGESDVDEVQDDEVQDGAQNSVEQDEVKVRFTDDIEQMNLLLKSHPHSPKPDEKLRKNIKKLQNDFIDERQERWQGPEQSLQRTWEDRNFLHHLAYCGQKSGPVVAWFMARVILRLVNTSAMGKMDASNRTPLTVAIHEKNYAFITAACSSVPKDKRPEMGQHLISECQDARDTIDPRGSTCLQSAILNLSASGNQAQSIINMIEFVPKKIFTTTDAQGRTPLHLAVNYSRGIGRQDEIVAKLLEKGPDALELRMLDQYGGDTVYQYHEKTRRDAENKVLMKPPPLPKKEPTPGDKKDEKGPESRKDRPEVRNAEKTAPSKGNSKSATATATATGGRATGQPVKRRESISINPGATTPTTRREAIDLPQLELKTRLEAEAGKGSTRSPVEQQRSTKPQQAGVDRAEETRRSNELEQRRAREANAAKIGELLKLAYLRKMKPQQAAQFLHIPDKPDKELWFDFGPEPRTKMTLESFKKHFEQFQHLDFDKVVQYVAFPRIQVDLGANLPDMRFQGSRHMVFFFQWLQKKGVERIVKVEVDEMRSKTPCHSDEAIEEALKSFGVEILDWRRPDLCPLMISRIGGNLHDVTLQWSGSNAVLRSWSEPEGLALTPSLRKIEIKHIEGLDSKEHTNLNLDEFEVRLKKSWPKTSPSPTFIRPKYAGVLRQNTQTGNELASAMSQTPEHHVDPHKWMQCMHTFALAFSQIKDIHDKPSDPLLHPVTVALIDDGADITLPELQVRPSPKSNARSFSGKSFDHFQGGWRVSPYWVSSGGHGTLMARLIHKVCPSAVIYVIKLKTEQTVNSKKLQIEPKSAIQAIEHAVEQGVRIISMSWTTKPPANSADKEAFDAAIRKAHSKGILMFCSASDQGNFEDFTYPYLSNPGYLFRIGAASKEGTVPDFVRDGRDISFLLPGREVPLDDGAEINKFEAFASHTGSSVATALAAGLAAMVIECVRLGAYHNIRKRAWGHGDINRDDVVKIRDKRAMEEAFNSISVNRSGNSKYIEVWETFTLPADNIKKQDGVTENQLDVIAKLAGSFLRKGVKG